MSKIALYISDIQGTLPEGSEDITLLFQTLDKVRKASGAEELLFTLSSTGNKKDVMEKMEELRPFMNGLDISFGDQYSETEAFDKEGNTFRQYETRTSKPLLATEQIAELLKENEVTWVGFADDMGELYPDINDIVSEAPTTIIYPDFGTPLTSERIIGDLEAQVNSFNKTDSHHL